MLTLCIFHIIPLDIISNSRNGTIVNGILNKFVASNICSFVHHRIHSITSLFFINFCHLRSHHIYNTKDYFTLLFTSTDPRKSHLDAFCFDAALVRENILGNPITEAISNYF